MALMIIFSVLGYIYMDYRNSSIFNEIYSNIKNIQNKIDEVVEHQEKMSTKISKLTEISKIDIKINSVKSNIDEALKETQSKMNDVINLIEESALKQNNSNKEIKNSIENLFENNNDKNTETLSIPECDTSFKTCMDYRSITVKNSEQYKIQQSSNVWTDEYGFRRYNNDYLAAMGSYYAPECNMRFEITFDTGNSITIYTGDVKADIHTNETNQYTAVYDPNGKFVSANVLEFIVDLNKLPRKCKLAGSVDVLDEFSGNIVSIKKLN